MHKRIKEGSITDTLFKVLEGVGMVMVAFMAPNAVQLFGLGGRRYTYPRRQMRTALTRLEEKGFIRCVGDRNAWKYRLTDEGRALLRKKHIDDIRIKKPEKWDGKWRMVIFDIPEKYSLSRYALRETLKRLNFQYVNLSVWIHPFECRDEVNAIVEYYGVGKYVRYGVVESLDGIDAIKPKFLGVVKKES